MKNNQQPTSNNEHPSGRARGGIGCWLLVVGCWLFSFLRPGRRAFVFGAIAGAAGFATAQSPLMFGKVNGFKVPEYFDPPNHKQIKTLLTGAVAEPSANGQLHITKLKLETFHEDGSREMVVEAPQCTYDFTNRVASSPGPIKATSGDGRLQIEGTGFMLPITNKSLTISNNVHTVIKNFGNAPLKP